RGRRGRVLLRVGPGEPGVLVDPRGDRGEARRAHAQGLRRRRRPRAAREHLAARRRAVHRRAPRRRGARDPRPLPLTDRPSALPGCSQRCRAHWEEPDAPSGARTPTPRSLLVRRAVLSPIAVVLGASLVLAGCGGSDSPSGDPTPSSAASEAPAEMSSDVPADQLPTASGAFGDKPELTFPGDEHLAEGAIHVLSEGTGDVVETGDLLLADYLGQVWGGEVFDNSYDRGTPAAFPIGVGAVVSGWDQ